MYVEPIMGAMFNFGVPLALLAAIFGFRWREGLWGNTIMAFCVLFSIFFAIAWWETVAELLCKAVPSMVFACDLVAIWTIFLVSLVILSELTRALSRVKVLFLLPLEGVGNFMVLVVLFLLMFNFFLLTYDLSPVGEKADATAPADSVLIYTFRALSQGTLEAFNDPHPFDLHGEFRGDHLSRRQALMKIAESKEATIPFLTEGGQIPPRKSD